MRDEPNRTLSSGELAILANAFAQSLKAITGVNGPAMDEGALKELSAKIATVIMEHFVSGDTDPEALKKAAVESVKLSGPSG
jgi:hypothetical protein